MRRVHVILVDDRDGGEADQTVRFALDGNAYEIDLSTPNAERLRATLAPWLAAARKPSRTRQSLPHQAGPGRGSTSSGLTADQLREIRAWAESAGYPIASRGRVSRTVLDAYAAAH